ncbi:UDP-GlcNAc:undecaprenyl-phosphate GlcNAc-1-phosphate transferase [Rhizobium sp. BK251]|nr:UDP-GlcNAc:undecaprenyl-phosphate GlcNAc-1-phosphate transferase [Rhizobium sp. BK251]
MSSDLWPGRRRHGHGIGTGVLGMFVLAVDSLFTLTMSAFLIAVLKRVSRALSLIDHPDHRKRHDGVIPLCGGIGIFLTFAAISLLVGNLSALGANYWLALFIVVAVGVIDDKRPLPATVRLAAQLAAAIILVSGVHISFFSFGALLPAEIAAHPPFLFLIAILFVAGLINAWNMMDGVDGLAGGSAAVALMWLLIIADFKAVPGLVFPIETLVAAICGFLAFNMRSPWRARASVFLGDAGSTALGLTIAYLIVILSTLESAVTFPALLWIVIIPVVDTLSLMTRRILARRSPMSADRWHLHHLFLDNGFSPAGTTGMIMLASAICGAIGFIGARAEVPAGVMAFSLILPVGAHTVFVLLASGHAPTWARALGLRQQILSQPTPEVAVLRSSDGDYGKSIVAKKTGIEA